MAAGPHISGNQPQQLVPLQSDQLAGGQFLCRQNGRLPAQQVLLPDSDKQVRHPARNVPHVVGPGLHILVLHSGKEGGEPRSRPLNRLASSLSPANGGVHRLLVIRVLQQHLVDAENGSRLHPRLVQGPSIEVLHLVHGAAPGGLKAVQLLLRGQCRPGCISSAHSGTDADGT